MTALAAAGAPVRLGKYEILSPLAAGGMARLYIARTTGIGSFERHVVLKLLLPERAHDETAVGMFLDEARLAAALHHQNVAQVFEVGEEQGQHYLAMEYVHGSDLRALLAKAGATGTKVPPDLALTIVAGAAAGLHHAHERRGPDGLPLGIVHRDVSPSNIMVAHDGAVKLLDFGIAKATARTIETQSGVIKGKFAYMSPEQCRGRAVDARSDGFALGIILYEVTTQHRCFRADSDFDTMHRIVTGDVTRPSKIIPGYPPALEAIVMKALSVDPAQRYQHVGEFLEALEQYAASARLAMSTMALGRFMRELFGDVPEPWLTSQRTSAPLIARESTISSTSAGAAVAVRAPTSPSARVLRATEPPPTTAATATAMPLSALAMPSTIPDVPRNGDDDVVSGDEWNARSYPGTAPSLIGDAAPATTPFRKTGGIPILPPPRAPATDRGIGAGFAPAPPSQSHSAATALPLSQPLAYPRYEPPPPEPDDGAPKRTRRAPLVLGVAGAAIAVVVVIVTLAGGHESPPGAPQAKLMGTVANGVMTSDDRAPAADPPPPTPAPVAKPVEAPPAAPAVAAKPDEAPPTAAKPVEVPPAPPTATAAKPDAPPPAAASPPPADDDQISVHVVTEPPGADVSLAGNSLGTTPLDTKVHRGTGSATLTIHRAKYADVTAKLDLDGDFSKDVALKPLDHAAAPKHDHAATPPAPPAAPKKCQPAGQVNPFDTSCNGQPCPPCK